LITRYLYLHGDKIHYTEYSARVTNVSRKNNTNHYCDGDKNTNDNEDRD